MKWPDQIHFIEREYRRSMNSTDHWFVLGSRRISSVLHYYT